MVISVEISPGELIDKLTILEIKKANLADPEKLSNAAYEYTLLTERLSNAVAPDVALDALRAELKSINEILWRVEDDIRNCERDKNFGPRFIELARMVYHTNDRRAAVKRRINELLNSAIMEEKSYAAY